jgi:transcriptional regulator with XRE-family HTH domain
MEAVLNKLGSRIKEIRKSKKLSQNELASLCEFEKASMSRIESGRSNLTLRSLTRICKALDVPITEMFANQAN